MRLFIAINFNQKTKNHIISVQERLKSVSCGRFSHPDNLHLTLAFLGEQSQSFVPIIKQVMDRVPLPTLHVNFDHVGCFHRDGGDIWWIGLQKNNALLKIQKQLSQELRACDFQLESHSFKPHLTLAREVKLTKEVDRKWLLNKPFETDISKISLMLSERINGKLTYTEL